MNRSEAFQYPILVFIGILWSQGVFGFNITVTDEGSNLPNKFSLVLFRYYQGQEVALDTVNVNSLPFRHEVVVNSSDPGLFFIGVLKEANRAEFIWSPDEPDLSIETSYWSLRNGTIQVENSRENSAYAMLISAKMAHDVRVEQLEIQLRSISAFEKNYKRQMTLYEDSIETAITELSNTLKEIQLRYPNTFVSTCLVSLNFLPQRGENPIWFAEYDGYLALMNEHYFDFLDLSQSALLNHYALEDKVILYLDRYTMKTTDGAQKGIDVIMNSVHKSPEIRSFIYNLLLKNFLNFKTETLARYLMERHADGCALNLSVQDLKRLSEMKSLMAGGLLPNVNLLDKDGQPQDLARYAAKNKYTIVYVWISWCVKCQGQSPKIARLYDTYRKKGLGVFSISLDEKKEDWLTALSHLGGNYPNVSELVPVKNSTVAPRFHISTTPKIFVINTAGEIIAKDLYGDELDSKIATLFK